MVRGLLRKIGTIFLVVLLTACNNPGDEESRLLGIAHDCDAALTRCHVSDGAIAVSLAMGPDVKPLQPFSLLLVIDAEGPAAENVVVDFQMQEMDMGINRYRLQRQEDGRWAGNVILPVCTVSRTDWYAVVEFSVDGKPLQAVFPFHTEAN